MGVKLNKKMLEYHASLQVNKLVAELEQHPEEGHRLEKLVKLVKVIKKSPLKPDYWQAQNVVFRLRQTVYPDSEKKCGAGDEEAVNWCRLFSELLDNLHMKV